MPQENVTQTSRERLLEGGAEPASNALTRHQGKES
jgi:hypothetical protein